MKPSGRIASTMAILLTLGISSFVYYYYSASNEKEKVVLTDSLYEPVIYEGESIETIKLPNDLLLETENQEEKKEEIIEESIVYDNMTLNELADKLDRTLSSDLAGKGNVFASYAIELGVDPYLAVAIAMHETGCTWSCSYLAKECNNVGGQKGEGCGEYRAYDTLDEGIYGFIANIKRNYVDYGLLTAEEMNPKYAEDLEWNIKVNKYIEKIKNN